MIVSPFLYHPHLFPPPHDAGEDEGGGLNGLNDWNVLNESLCRHSRFILCLPLESQITAYPCSPGGRLVNTVRIAAHRIAGERVSPRAASAADKFKFAHATLPFDLRIIAHRKNVADF